MALLAYAPCSAQSFSSRIRSGSGPPPLPRIDLIDRASVDILPLTFVHQTPEAAAEYGPPVDSGPASASHAGGCGCAGCQSGGGEAFPGYDQLGYTLHGGCPPVVISEEWCRRPFYFDVFIGALWGDELVNGQIDQEISFLAGGRLGWDLNGAWGVEARLAWSEVGISNVVGPVDNRQAELFLWDVSLLHYFGSHLKLRPYCALGLGAVDWEYTDINGNTTDEKVFGVPVSLGLKQRLDDWLVLRLDLTDNIAFGSGTPLGTQHNLSITGNVEIRFGGPRTSYWAWAPRKHYSW